MDNEYHVIDAIKAASRLNFEKQGGVPRCDMLRLSQFYIELAFGKHYDPVKKVMLM